MLSDGYAFSLEIVKIGVGDTVGDTELGILICPYILYLRKLGILFIHLKKCILVAMFLVR